MTLSQAPQCVIIISDLDSVLCETVPAALRWVFDRYGVVIPPSAITQYDMEIAVEAALGAAGMSVSTQKIAKAMRAACWNNPSFFRQLAPRVEIWAALTRWIRRGGTIQWVTKRQGLLRQATESWLVEHELLIPDPRPPGRKPQTSAPTKDGPVPGYRSLELDAPKATIAAAACGHYQHVYVLEDAMHHVRDISAESQATVWVVQQPWNEAAMPRGCSRLDDHEIGRRIGALGHDLSQIQEIEKTLTAEA